MDEIMHTLISDLPEHQSSEKTVISEFNEDNILIIAFFMILIYNPALLQNLLENLANLLPINNSFLSSAFKAFLVFIAFLIIKLYVLPTLFI
jgi:glucan phosphoethanolaminetransferase (alkaline phosphatase superfamily)